MSLKGFPLIACENDFYNSRTKYIIDKNGEVKIIEVMTFQKRVFNPLHLEKNPRKVDKYADIQEEKEYLQDKIFLANEVEYMSTAFADSIEIQERENKKRSSRRAKTKVRDYILANDDLKYFITLTLSGADFERSDIKTAVKKLNIFLRNRVQRDGLKYIIVPELHKDGKSIHFHGLINEAVQLVESGTYIPPCGGKPLKAETIKRKGISLDDCRKVYNIPGWKYGFTTAIAIDENICAVASYIGKYITKDIERGGDKICGRFYYSSNNLDEPKVSYCNIDYENAKGIEITQYCNAFKIFYPD